MDAPEHVLEIDATEQTVTTIIDLNQPSKRTELARAAYEADDKDASRLVHDVLAVKSPNAPEKHGK